VSKLDNFDIFPGFLLSAIAISIPGDSGSSVGLNLTPPASFALESSSRSRHAEVDSNWSGPEGEVALGS